MIDYLPPLVLAYPWVAVAGSAVAVVLVVIVVRGAVRTVRGRAVGKGEIIAAGVAAALCTLYSGDTAWRFAGRELDMIHAAERVLLFAAGEVALLACALMARRKALTSRDGSAGPAGALVWVITGVQLVPAFSEGGLTGGFIRAFFGPILAALLWHIAMGLEIFRDKPEVIRDSLLFRIGRDLRERLLSRLGLEERGKDAVEISQDRALARAVELAARLEQVPEKAVRRRRRTTRRLSGAIGRSGAGDDPARRAALLARLAARRHAASLATVALPSPWTRSAATTLPPRATGSALGVSGDQLRNMHPVEAVHVVRDAHPDLSDAHLASLLTEHGVTVSSTMVSIALRADRRPEITPDVRAPEAHSPSSGCAREQLDDDADTVPDPRLEEARAVDRETWAAEGRCASLRRLQREMRIGQGRAQRIRAQLDASRGAVMSDNVLSRS